MLLATWALLRRRWVTALAGLMLAAAICANVGTLAQPEYRATGQMMFLLPPEQPDPEDPPVNPYLNLPEGMGATANLIAGMVTTDDVARSLADQGLVAEYTVSLMPGSGPVLVIEVTAADATTALETRDALMALVDEDLATLQERAKTPANQVMTASRPTVSRTAKSLHGPVYKAVAAAGAGGLIVLLLLCLLVDRLVLFRAARAERARAVATADVVAAAKERTRLKRVSRAIRPSRAASQADTTTEADDDGADDGDDDGENDGPAPGDPAAETAAAPADLAVGPTTPRRRERNARRRTAARPDRTDQNAPDEDDTPQKLAG